MERVRKESARKGRERKVRARIGRARKESKKK